MATSSKAVTKAKVAGLPANIEADMASEIAGFQNRLAAPTGDRISIANKQFKLPNGDVEDTLSVIIVDFVSYNAYYDKPYNPQNITPANCFALGIEPTGLIPSSKSPDIQAESCAACWANQWKSGNGNGKACGNHKLLACIAPDGDADSPIMILKVSPTGLKSFDAYVAQVARTFQRPPRGVITEITCDPNLDYASLRFGNAVPATKDQLAFAYSRREEAMQRLLTEPDATAFGEAAVPAGVKGKPASKKPVGKR